MTASEWIRQIEEEIRKKLELPAWCAMAEAVYQGILNMTNEQRQEMKPKFTDRQWYIMTRGMPW